LLVFSSHIHVKNANRDGQYRANTCNYRVIPYKGKVVRRGSALRANGGQSAQTEKKCNALLHGAKFVKVGSEARFVAQAVLETRQQNCAPRQCKHASAQDSEAYLLF
jgi:hypothetical protein